MNLFWLQGVLTLAHLLVLGTALELGQETANSGAGEQSEHLSEYRMYNDLNQLLTNNVRGEDVKSNLKFVEKLWRNKLDDGSDPNEPYVRILKTFSDLGLVNTDKKCSRESFYTLTHIYKIGGHRAMEHSGSCESLRRTDRIFKDLITKHAQKCQKVYLNTFKNRLPQLDSNILNRLEQVLNLDQFIKDEKTVAQDLFRQISSPYSQFVDKVLHPSLLLKGLRKAAEGCQNSKYLWTVDDEATGKQIVDKAKFKELFDAYLVEPCNYLKNELGLDVIAPITLDAKFHHQVEPKQVGFYNIWARGFVCYKLLHGDLLEAVYNVVLRRAAESS